MIIEKYNREISQWQEFWTQYEMAIHSNDALCKRERFTYLKSDLTGAAVRSIMGLTMTDGNYDTSVDLLQNPVAASD